MYQRIMVPLDGSELAECVLPHVEALTKLGGVREVILVRVVEPVLPHETAEFDLSEEVTNRINSESRVAAENYLDQLVSRLDYGRVNIKSEVFTGKAAESLADYVKRNKVDLVIIATHGRSGISRWVWGSVADRILRSSHAPVLMVRAPGARGLT